MANFAGYLGVPLGPVRKLKAMGCPGFPPSGRVESGPLMGWLLTQGKRVDSGRSLTEAKARLADARADHLERQDLLRHGNVVSVLWARDVVGECLELPRQWMTERVTRLAYLVSTACGDENQQRRQASVMGFLEEDAKAILTMIGHAETKIHQAFAKGFDGPERTALGDLDVMCECIKKGLSDSCRAEISAFTKTLHEEREAAQKQSPAEALTGGIADNQGNDKN